MKFCSDAVRFGIFIQYCLWFTFPQTQCILSVSLIDDYDSLSNIAVICCQYCICLYRVWQKYSLESFVIFSAMLGISVQAVAEKLQKVSMG